MVAVSLLYHLPTMRALPLYIILIVTALVVISHSLEAQVLLQRPNKTDALSRRQGDWIIFFNDQWEEIPSEAEAIYYRLISYHDDVPVGVASDYYRNGVKQWEGSLLKDRPDIPDGKQVWYYENGVVKTSDVYKDTVAISSISYLRNGELADPEWQTNYYDVGMALVEKNDDAGGLRYFQKALANVEAFYAKESEEYADVLEWIVICEHGLQAHEASLKGYLELMRIYRITRKPGDVDLLKATYNAARLYKNSKRYEQAQQLLEYFFSEEKKGLAPYHEMHGLALSALADVYLETMRYSEAVVLLTNVLDYYKKNPPEEPMENELASYHMRRARFLTGEWTEGKKFMLDELKKSKQAKGENTEEYVYALSAIGNYSRVKGQLKEAELYFLEAVKIVDNNKFTNLAVVISAFLPLAEIYQQLGQPNLSSTYIEKAKLVFQKADKNSQEYYPLYVPFLARLVMYYNTLGNTKEVELALAELKSATAKTYGNQSAEYATALSNESEFLLTHRRFKECIPLLKQADEIMKQFGNKELSATDIRTYGKVLQQLATATYLQYTPIQTSAVAEAEKYIQQSEKVYGRLAEQSFIPELVDVYLTEGLLQEYRGLTQDADASYAKCEVMIRNHFGTDHTYYATILFAIAKKSELRGDFKKSYSYYKLAIEKHNRYLHRVLPYLSTEEKESFYQANVEWVNNYQSFISLNVAQEPSLADDLYNLQLSNKGVVFQSLNRIRKVVAEKGSPQLKELYEQWRKSKNDLVKAYHSAAPAGQSRNDSWSELENEVGDLEKKISAQSTEFSQFLNQADITWKQVQANLKYDEAAIEISRIPREINEDTIYIAMIVRKADIHPLLIEIGSAKILEGKAIKFYRNAAILHIEDLQSFDIYWQSVAKNIEGIKRIFLSADGVYHQMNVATLFDPAKKKFVFDDLDVRIVPSTVLLSRKLTSSRSISKVILFAHPDYGTTVKKNDANLNRDFDLQDVTDLPGTEKERVALTDILDSKHIAYHDYAGTDASEENVKGVNEPSILHFATHGFFLNDVKTNTDNHEYFGFKGETLKANPLLRSGLLMAGCQRKEISDSNEDGILTAFEASTLELFNTELVVLSACETGLGEIKNGEGVYGLQRAFAMAGAKQIVMSLWKVDDEATQQFMTAFYQHYLDTNDAGEAFRFAQQKIKETYPSPYFWGAFVISGM
jgi:CHAT domain-containing protein